MRYPQARILLFAKAPVAGRVKTRLIPALGAEGAAELYGRLLISTVQWIAAAQIAPLVCWCTPGTEHQLFQQLSRDYDVSLKTQIGPDLGERMRFAAESSLQEGGLVLLLGGDCPSLNVSHLLQALDWLESGGDAVLAPAEDGGYVLLGLKKLSERLFQEIPWGGDQVLAITRDRLRDLAWHWRELETLWDLDRPADVDRYLALRGMNGAG